MSSFHFEFTHSCSCEHEQQHYIQEPTQLAAQHMCTTSFMRGIADGMLGAKASYRSWEYDSPAIRYQGYQQYGNAQVASKEEYIEGFEIGWRTGNYVLDRMPLPRL